MHLIAPLASGIRGAENGAAALTQRGTATPAAWYFDFEASASSTSIVALDANGGAIVYVNELVDVTVNDSTGAPVRYFVAGAAAPAVEVRSQSFVGVDYRTGQSATGNPTTLQGVLDLWKGSAGATNFQVLLNGAATDIQTALSGAALYINVKGAPYNAAGDGVTDDTSAVQAALTAATNAGGGTVFFPAGTYRVTATLTCSASVSLLGVGTGATTLTIDHASNSLLQLTSLGSGRNYISHMSLLAAQANSGVLLDLDNVSSHVEFDSCIIGNASCDGDLINGSDIRARNCDVTVGSSTSRAVVGLQAYLDTCTFSISGSYGPTGACIYVSALVMSNCFISTTATGTYNLLGLTGGAQAGFIVNSAFIAAAGIVTALTATFSSVTWLYETANLFTGMTAIYGGTASETNTGKFFLGTRELRKASTVTVGSVVNPTLDALNYGRHLVSITANGNETINAAVGPSGASLTVVFDNDAGVNSGTIAFGTGFMTLGSFTVASGKIRIFRFVSMDFDGTLCWVKECADTGDIG